MYPNLSGLKDRLNDGYKFSAPEKFDHFSNPKHGYENVGGGDEDSPTSFDEIERPPLRHVDKYIRAEIPGLSARYTVSILTCVGFIIQFGMKSNPGSYKGKPEFQKLNWSIEEVEAFDSSFSWGYFFTQLPGGFLASKYPANRIFGAAIASSCLLNLITPFLFEHIAIVIPLRVLQGLIEGVTYPSCHGIMRYWAPPAERSRLATMAFTGTYAGVVIGLPLSNYLAEWFPPTTPFIFFSFMGFFWYLAWLWLVFEKPRVHPTISIEEMKYIEKSLSQTVNHTMPTLATTPWKDIITSKPVYAIVVANFCRSYNFYMLLQYQPTYLRGMFEYNLGESGLLSALPHLLMTILVPIGGLLADKLRKSGKMSTTNVRKLFNCGGFGMEGLSFLILAHCKSREGAMVALTIGIAMSGFAISGYNVNHLDIAPRYASILMGISNGVGTLGAALCPIVVNKLANDRSPKGWPIVFTIAGLIHLFGITVYGVFASGELQSWAEPVVPERPVWSPTKGQGVTETSFNDANQTTQLNLNTANYGATGHVPNNPFAASSISESIIEENVQPEPKDIYMHGTTDDRNY